MVGEAVFGRADAGDAALGVRAVALGDAVFGDDEDGEVGRHFEGRAKAGDPGPDDEHVRELVQRPPGVEGGEVTVGRWHAVSLGVRWPANDADLSERSTRIKSVR